MKKRVLVNIAVLCCLLLAVGCLVLWPISYWYSYRGYIGQHRGATGVGFDIRSTPGAAEFVLITFQADEGTPPGGFRHYVEALRWADEPNVLRHWE